MKHYPNQFLIRNFIKDMKASGFVGLCSALTHKECRSLNTSQIRKVKAVLALGWDCLGNCTVLTKTGYVMQLTREEFFKMEKAATI
tara:strand:+ start:51 stop:308 length:258 start_codon:yes stop_codon:yes gene_type:complete